MSVQKLHAESKPDVDRLVEAIKDAHGEGRIRCLIVAWSAERTDPKQTPWRVDFAGFDTLRDADQAIGQLERAKYTLIDSTMECDEGP